MITILLSSSLIVNILLFWYARKLLQKLAYFSQDIEEVNDNLQVFASHIDKLHSMETYYGDEDLQNLLNHAQSVAEGVKQFKNLYVLGEIEEGNEGNAQEEEQEIE